MFQYLLAVCVIGQDELQVIINVRLIFVHHSKSVAVLELKLHRIGIDYSSCDRKIVDKQMHKVLVSYSFRHFLRVLSVPVHRKGLCVAQKFAIDVLRHSHFIRRVDNSVTCKIM